MLKAILLIGVVTLVAANTMQYLATRHLASVGFWPFLVVSLIIWLLVNRGRLRLAFSVYIRRMAIAFLAYLAMVVRGCFGLAERVGGVRSPCK